MTSKRREMSVKNVEEATEAIKMNIALATKVARMRGSLKSRWSTW